MRSVETELPEKSDLENYFQEGCYIAKGDAKDLDVLEWWKVNHMKYRVLSQMACDILVILITISAGSRVIDTYSASLSPETVQVSLYGTDWCRNLHGVKKKHKVIVIYFYVLSNHGMCCYHFISFFKSILAIIICGAINVSRDVLTYNLSQDYVQ